MTKRFKLSKDEIKPLVRGYGSCFASDMITIDGELVGYLYREEPDNQMDSGWRFLSGLETDEYMSNPENFAIYDVNTIANYDQEIIPLLGSPVGSAFERIEGLPGFQIVQDE